MKNYHTILILVFVIVIVVVSASLALVLQSDIEKKVERLEAQEQAPIEGAQIGILTTTPPSVTPVSLQELFGGSPAPTEPPLPQTDSDFDRESDYIEDLLNEAGTEDLGDASLNLD